MQLVGDRLGVAKADAASAEVWCAWVREYAADVARLSADYLSPAERDRRASYRSSAAAARFVVTRALVRTVLAGRLGAVPREIPITLTDLGKPIVAGELHFNVSHSGDLVLLAVAEDRAVGIDVERQREVPRAQALIDRWLTEAERREVARRIAAGSLESDAFLRVWSLKEARLKALGVGIAGAPGTDAESLPAVGLDELLAGLHDAAGYIGAVAFA